MLANKSSVRANWVALSCAHHMNGNPELALAVIDIMSQIMDAGNNPHEKSEVHLYRAELEMLLKRPAKTLEILKHNDADIADNRAKELLRAAAFVALGQKDKAEKLYLDIIAKGASESDCITALARSRGIDVDSKTHLPIHHYNRADAAVVAQCNKFVELCDTVISAAPRCDAAKRFALDTCSDDTFEGRLSAYIKPYVSKMIPSVTFILKSLYNYFPATDARITTIGKVFHSWEAQLEAGDYDAYFGASAAGAPAVDRNPALLLWVYQFLASHYLRIKNYSKAHEYADKAIEHTPTIEMLYLLKAKICSREGDLVKAAELAETARRLDLQDKYLSAKSAKYYLRTGEVEKAEGNLKLFMKEELELADVYLTAIEAQTVWYEREVGDAFMLKNDPISALQNYSMFEKHHKDNHDEMVDFHNYTFRRCTMRQWLDVQEKDELIGLQRFFLLVCPKFVKAYLAIAKAGEEAVRSSHVPRAAPTTTEGKKDKETEAEEKLKLKQYNDFYLKDIDISNPLVKARRYIDALLQYSPNEASTHILAIEYFLALPTFPAVLAVRSLQQLKTISKEDGTGVQGAATTIADRTKAKEQLAVLKAAFTKKWEAAKGTDSRVAAVVDGVLKAL
eukprot:GILJ01021070.1.p1 GENE.GILJ01021070.1~~GILJ01021070.1.p1  ORF type:complete len:656 (+),score=167.75 GILJ01021070.1:105-1970(+)